MFCGQCGRAITAADVAAYAARQKEQGAPSLAPGEIPAWELREPPAAVVPPGTPWWLGDRVSEPDSGDAPERTEDDVEAGSPERAERAAAAEPVAAGETSVVGGSAEIESTEASEPSSSSEPAATSEPDEASRPDEASGPDDASEPDGTSRPAQASEAAEATEGAGEAVPAEGGLRDGLPDPAPAPLRQPGPVLPGSPLPSSAPSAPTRASGRPVSAPLWTASLTPISPEQAAADAAAREAAGESTGEGSRADDESVAGRSTSESESSTARPAESAGPQGTPASGSVDPDEPRPGDTNVIQPLVTPARPGSDGRLRCTVCGAALSDDDIFCGECGTVVQAVAQSFTGPITPILTHPVASDAAAEPEPAADEPPLAERRALEQSEADEHLSDGDADGDRGDTSLGDHQARNPETRTDTGGAAEAPAPRPAPLAPTPLPPSGSVPPPFVPDPEPAPKQRRRFFGRRAEKEAPKLWGDAAVADTSSPVPPAPPAPPVETQPLDEVAQPAPPPVSARSVPAVPETVEDSPAPAPLKATPVDDAPESGPAVMAPVPPAPESPRPAAPWAVGSPIDDIEQTRIVARRPLGEPYTLQFSTGESFTVQGTGLVGRAPTPQPGDMIDLLVRIIDPGKSVSKTHLEFGQDDGQLWISDRWSGNGTVLRPPAAPAKRCEPGKRVRVPRGSRIDIGEQFFTVS
ncbi:FHA domain-containing protein [Frondihabitans australicus]|uniref:FHA domain-containing protein n=2 Tax=Frondihabitans australicus TaxID=386892 RepID=A0A495ICT6_9MICO|nr:FHA domain-containing protein [Frondihabitans australicus]